MIIPFWILAPSRSKLGVPKADSPGVQKGRIDDVRRSSPAQAPPMSASRRPLACVAGDLSLVRALGRSGISVAAAVQGPDSLLRLSRYCVETVTRRAGWTSPGRPWTR